MNSDLSMLAYIAPWPVRICPDCSWWSHHRSSRDGDICPDCREVHSRQVELAPAMLHITPMEDTP